MYNKLNKKAIYVMMINSLLLFVFLGITILITYLIYNSTDSELSINYINIGVGIVSLYAILNLVLFPFIRYERYAYKLTSDTIDVKKGLFVITRNIVPIIKVQKIEISNGPIDRLFNLSNIDIYTGAGVTKISFLENKKAELLCDEINALLKEKQNGK